MDGTYLPGIRYTGDALTETSAMKQSFGVDHTDHTLTLTD